MKSPIALMLGYAGALTTAVAVTAVGLTAVVGAATGVAAPAEREKTALQTQIETARAIKVALATPVVVPPLAPVTARRPANRETRDVAALPRSSQPASLQTNNIRVLAAARPERQERPIYAAPAPSRDRHTTTW